MKLEQLPKDVLLQALGFDVYKASNAPQVIQLVEDLLGEVRASGRFERYHDKKIRVCLETIVLNLFTAWQHDEDAPLLHYTRNTNLYPGTRLGYDTLINTVIPCLQKDLGYIETRKNIGDGLEARMCATGTLIGLFQQHKLSLSMVRSAAGLEFRRPKVGSGTDRRAPRLRSLPPDRVDLQWLSKQYSDNLMKINQLLQDSFIGLLISDKELRGLNARLTNSSEEYDDDGLDPTPPKSPVDFTRKTLRRIFNNVLEDNPSLDKGGRFAGAWWQNIPSEYRKHIWINDEPGFEYDFSSMEPALAYAAKGLDVRKFMDDPYVIPEMGKDFRALTKRILIIMLNCDCPDKALGAAEKYVRWEYSGVLPQGNPTVKELVDKLKCLHSSLDFYVKDEGLHRMFRESRIAERIMLELTEQGIPVLPIHDSFIVPASQHEALELAMYDAFGEEANQGCNITWESDWIHKSSMFWDYFTEEKSGLRKSPSKTPDNVAQSEYSKFFRLRKEHDQNARAQKCRKRA